MSAACKKEPSQGTGSGSQAGSGSGSMMPADAAGTGSGSGSDLAAGSAGSGAGSDTVAAGSGSDAAGSAGATIGSAGATTGSGDTGLVGPHRAGNCPSMVLGSTTTTAVKGKTVVVTIESSDADAVLSIQKRTDDLLADKKELVAEGATGGGGHNQKGAHGGGQGLCPVYVPDGAKATAKHAAKGVVVTITPKDKVDELSHEVEGRIVKASAWVQTNIQAAPQGNQGGVGGGKNADGSNHSGHGDGSGHLRKAGGGAGTGGGGGAGTGGGSAGTK
ncbi:MAG TPA: hypothetical protein VGC42_17045 [Kofleriaceae bacterium]